MIPGLTLRALLLLTNAAPVESLSAGWTHWRFFHPVELEEASEPRLANVVLPMDVFGNAQASLADLRLIDQDDQEVSYVLFIRRSRRSRQWLTGRVTETSFVPGEYTQLIVDTGGRGLHNCIEARLEETDFFARVEVAVRNDLDSWRALRVREPIYGFPSEGVRAWSLSYPETHARRIRLRILYGERQLRIHGVRVARESIEEAVYVDWPLEMRPASPHGRETTWYVDAGYENVPVSAVRFEAEQPEFHRVIRLDASQDGKEWRSVGEGSVYRIHDAEMDAPGVDRWRTSLLLEIPEARGRHWRVTVMNRDDDPVRGLCPILQTTPYRLVFRQEPGASYRLLYGNNRTRKPSYDMKRLTSRTELQSAFPGRLGARETNPGYTSPEPWTERHPAILWVALVAAVLVLGFLAIRSLRRVSNAGDE